MTLFDTDPRTLNRIRKALDPVALVAAASFDPARRIECSRLPKGSLAVIAARSQGDANWNHVRALVAAGVRVIVAGAAGMPGDAREAMRAGAEAFVVGTDEVALRQTVTSLISRPRPPARRPAGPPTPPPLRAAAAIAGTA